MIFRTLQTLQTLDTDHAVKIIEWKNNCKDDEKEKRADHPENK